jgi:misacylated tRNA(Ala) deacylase
MTEEIFREEPYRRSTPATIVAQHPEGFVLDRTVFYYESGGQPGDSGRLELADGTTIPIGGTKRDRDSGAILHLIASGAPSLRLGTPVIATLDWERRHRHMRMHSCLHLLCAVVPGAVTGGQVGDGKGRLDFDVATDTLDRERIESKLNELIAANVAISPRWIEEAELAARPELVRTMSVKPPTGRGRVRLIEIAGVDLQPCGGTHLAATAEIGPVRVAKIENKGRQNRRVIVQFAD